MEQSSLSADCAFGGPWSFPGDESPDYRLARTRQNAVLNILDVATPKGSHAAKEAAQLYKVKCKRVRQMLCNAEPTVFRTGCVLSCVAVKG